MNTQASAEKNDLNNINQDKLFIVEEPFSDKIKNYYQFQPLSLNSSGHKDILLKYESYLAIVSAIKKYQQIKLLGGWPTISKDIELKIGNRSEQIVNLRKRLLITGDIKANIGIEDVFDVFVEDGIKQFQYRHGLDSNGKLNMDTINALNQTVDSKLSQLGANKIRLLNNLSNIDEAYVLVNIPANNLSVIQDGEIIFESKVIVGKEDRQTPLINSDIYEVNFFPFWHIPKSIVEKDIVKAVLSDPNYLNDNNIYIYQDYYYKNPVNPKYIDWETEEPLLFNYRQNPGNNNSLGIAKINFANKHAVYLHDTPEKLLFNQDIRIYSSGCVRVQNIDDLIDLLLSKNKNWSRALLNQILDNDETVTIKLNEQIPIKIIYLSAWAGDGKVHFRRDIYGRDGIKSL
ncbi:MAG: L,D-transpeptidase family protein [Hyphomicrobiales bacterium]|nr:L,D-transpeptidase family protein [Hyphomicrobiales bacterium]